mgnify:CR=1 FL=1
MAYAMNEDAAAVKPAPHPSAQGGSHSPVRHSDAIQKLSGGREKQDGGH